ncbi:MAG: sulfatase [Candidatus Eisenbacteria bacterium]|nr:sulfatase [Candidatus Eisenbacteria bacterium]
MRTKHIPASSFLLRPRIALLGLLVMLAWAFAGNGCGGGDGSRDQARDRDAGGAGKSARQASPAGPIATLPAGTPVLFISIETFRHDHMSRNGYERETTPFLDEFASEGAYFSNCYAQCSWTLPAMLTLISSLPPPVYGIKDGVAPVPKAGAETVTETAEMELEIFSDAHTTLAEALRDRGYRTIGISTSGHLIQRQGFTQGFDRFDETGCMWGTAECALPRALEAIESSPSPDSLFVWVHLFDPHFDEHGRPPRYVPPAGYETMFGGDEQRDETGRVVANYDRKLRYTDDKLREFFARLDASGRLDRFLVVITGDHGEEFNEKGRWGHSKALTNTLLHVPLIIRLPGGQAAGRVAPDLVRHLDVMPTILDLLGIPAPAAAEGASLKAALEGRALPLLPVYAETRRMGLAMLCLIDPALDRKVVMDFRSRAIQLYDFAGDPREEADLSTANSAEARDLAFRLKAMSDEMSKRAVIETAPGHLDERERERLRSLGYLGGG